LTVLLQSQHQQQAQMIAQQQAQMMALIQSLTVDRTQGSVGFGDVPVQVDVHHEGAQPIVNRDRSTARLDA